MSYLKKLSLKHLFLLGFLGLYTRFYFTGDILTILFGMSTTCAFFWMEYQESQQIKKIQQDEFTLIKTELAELKSAIGMRQMRKF